MIRERALQQDVANLQAKLDELTVNKTRLTASNRAMQESLRLKPQEKVLMSIALSARRLSAGEFSRAPLTGRVIDPSPTSQSNDGSHDEPSELLTSARGLYAHIMAISCRVKHLLFVLHTATGQEADASLLPDMVPATFDLTSDAVHLDSNELLDLTAALGSALIGLLSTELATPLPAPPQPSLPSSTTASSVCDSPLDTLATALSARSVGTLEVDDCVGAKDAAALKLKRTASDKGRTSPSPSAPSRTLVLHMVGGPLSRARACE